MAPPPADTTRYGRGMIWIAWLAALGLLYMFFDDHLEKLYNPNPEPGSVRLENDLAQVSLLRNRFGHYITGGRINGQPVTFMLDTGATNVSIPATVARRLRLDRGSAMQAQTAAGVVTVHRTMLDDVRIGDIQMHDIRGSINPHMDGEEILLGMSFLKQIEFRQRGDELLLIGPAAP